MKLDLSALPNNVDALQALVREQAVLLQSKEIEIERRRALARKRRETNLAQLSLLDEKSKENQRGHRLGLHYGV